MSIDESTKRLLELYKDGKTCSSCNNCNIDNYRCNKFDLDVYIDFTCLGWVERG